MSKNTQNKNKASNELPTCYNELLELADLCTTLQGDLWQYRHVSDYMKNIENQITELKNKIWEQLEKIEDEQ